MTRQAFVASRVGEYDAAAVADAVQALIDAPLPTTATGRAAALPKGFPTGDVRRWVPIGPSVARRGQAGGRPRVNGRIRDLAVSSDGARLYAASAMGGLWYSSDGAATWSPVGGWADRAARAGGANNAQSCGCLLVTFGATAADDLVLVGTGETVPDNEPSGEGSWGGLGILAAQGPADQPIGANPWEDEAGAAVLEGLGVFRMARDPAVVVAAQQFVAGTDRVLAATSSGLFLGSRTHQAAPLPHDEFSWAALPGIDQLVLGGPPAAGQRTSAVTDVLWLTKAGNANGRIVVTIRTGRDRAGNLVTHGGLAFSDDLGQNFTWVNGCNTLGGVLIQGTSSIALSPGTNTVYVLSALPAPPPPPHQTAASDTPALFQVPDIVPAAGNPQATQVLRVPATLWGAQRDYDQALAVDRVGGTTDRVYLGGSTVELDGEYGASLWCFDVGAGPGLDPAVGISRTAAPPAGEGATTAGCIGNDVHADIHSIVLGGMGTAGRQVWVGCDGGVFVSVSGGRVHTFGSASVGLAALQAGYVAAHPTSSHFVAAGFQDNGTQVRAGDTVWEEIFEGDGGGLAFHPWQSHYIVGQWTTSVWNSAPAAGFVQPTTRLDSGLVDDQDREAAQTITSFYSGCAFAASPPATARLALGTNRVWLSENLAAAATNTWRVLPYPTGTPTDPRPGGADNAPRRGVPNGGTLGAFVNATTSIGPLSMVVTVRWASPTVLIALFRRGVVRWTENPPGQWTTDVPISRPAGTAPFQTILTDLFPVPGTGDFYLTTTGDPATPATDTCYLWDDASKTLVPTGLRHVLDTVGPPALGALEPAYAVVVDAAQPNDVYVGTVTGVWHGVRTPGTTTVVWQKPPFVNGLPPAAVQDLSVWQDPAGGAGSPRLLRAALQARGVWEVDLAAASEPVRTYLRVHARDDRRRFPTPLADPRRGPTAPVEPAYASPDITVRPKASPATAPAWRLGAGTINAGNVPSYQLWTFQTAFRWIYPSVVAHGLWSQKFADLVRVDRGARGLSVTRVIDQALWNAVVGGVRLDPAGAVSANAANPLAVYREPWQSPSALHAVATEVDLIETVQPRSVTRDVWSVFAEPCTVDVLLHHRDSRPVPSGSAFAILLWMSAPAEATLLGADASTIAAYAATVAGGLPQAPPAGWTLASPGGGAALNALPVDLDARLPRAVPIDVDLSAVPVNDRVLFLAIGGSNVDPCTAPPVGLPANPTVVDLVRCWPYAALRMVRVTHR